MNIPTTPAGAQLLSCDIDTKCEELVCDTCLNEIPASLLDTPEVHDYVMHYCGLECAGKMQARHDEEKAAG